jgi:hypothetical protein
MMNDVHITLFGDFASRADALRLDIVTSTRRYTAKFVGAHRPKAVFCFSRLHTRLIRLYVPYFDTARSSARELLLYALVDTRALPGSSEIRRACSM